jgi:hypothetical protein
MSSKLTYIPKNITAELIIMNNTPLFKSVQSKFPTYKDEPAAREFLKKEYPGVGKWE